ncbi:MAG: peptidoglycan DD-metalloendopeptidase family protein [Gammaproteobacteria bacterium]|nr:peptidoglycan DD-metalloendopeptidase family protein [Gammaproteobacteria bacterium]
MSLQAVLPLPASAQPQNAAEAEQDLIDLQKRLKQMERELGEQAKQRTQTQQDLQQAEKKESSVRSRLKGLKADISSTRKKLAALESEAEESRDRLSVSVSDLEEELRRAYIAGREDWLRSVLSQKDPVLIGRQLVYSSYLAKERNELTMKIRGELADLDITMAELAQEKERLSTIQEKEQARLSDLAQVREKRAQTLSVINEQIASSGEEIEQLRLQAAERQALVDELTQALTSLPVGDSEPFAKAKGRLEWPAKGKISKRFGASRAGGRLRWDGVLIAAQAGREVQAVYNGRVVYADWLPGMGLLVIMDHGSGYLSLYGHNQDVVAEVGDWVSPGMVIAHVGDSGGQATPGLYFEIRKDGKPLDPALWVGR